MKTILLRLKTRLSRHPRAQGLLEFALALPVLLLLVFGIIEFGRLMQAYLALENGARFAVRYAVTGNFDINYCAEAITALTQPGQPYENYTRVPSGGGSAQTLGGMDNYDGQIDCRVPDDFADWETVQNDLIDYARLPSIYDTAMAGATGIDYSDDPAVSGDYIDYISTPYNIFNQANRGNPSQPGYLNIMTCSNRHLTGNQQYVFEGPPDYPYYYGGIVSTENTFPMVCKLYDNDAGQEANNRYRDDGGGPGDRVRVILTYRHTMITPFLSSWWPTLRLTSQREGIVEKFRTSRVTGLTGGMAIAPTRTHTPLPPTETPTLTPTATPAACDGANSILREYWEGIGGSTLVDLTGHVNYPNMPSSWGYPTTIENPVNRGENYGTRYRGYVCPPYSGAYTFYIASDDASRLMLSASENPATAARIAYIDGWTDSRNWSVADSRRSTPKYLVAGNWYYIEVVHKEGGGGDNVSVAWSGPGIGTDPTLIDGSKYLKPAARDNVTPVLCDGPNGILRETWNGISGSDLDALTNTLRNPDWPNYPSSYDTTVLTEFRYANIGDNYGARLQAYLCPPYDGDYTFWLASDDEGRLNLSTDMDPAHKSIIASVPGWTSDQVYDTYPSQQSVTIPLQAGTRYYIEGLFKEGGGGDHISVAWTGPYIADKQIIPVRYLAPLPPQATRTPTVTPTPSCSAVQFNDPLYLEGKYINASIYNSSVLYPMTINRIAGRWLNPWHTLAGDTRPTMTMQTYTWGATVINNFADFNLTAPVLTWNHVFGTPYTVAINTAGNLRMNANRNFSTNTFSTPNKPTDQFNYYHGADFELTLYYTVGNQACETTLRGVTGPTLNPQLLDGPNQTFTINAHAAATAGRALQRVDFTVFNSSGVMIHYLSTTSAPYCLFGRSGSNCIYADPYISYWNGGTPGSTTTGDNILIVPGTYRVSIIARDCGTTDCTPSTKIGQYSTRTEYTFNLVASTPTRTNTPLPTNTPRPTRTFTLTPLPSRTPTVTNTPLPTFTFTNTVPPTRTSTPTTGPSITPTRTPSLTPSPTKCLTPPELGGCK